jgi:hypothetical protein
VGARITRVWPLNKSSFQAVLAEDEKQSVIVKKVVDSLKCEQMTNDYIIGRLKSLAWALGRYPQTNTDATGDFFKVATGSEEDRSFSQTLGRKDENSQECQQFKRYTHLILDLCDSIENGEHESAVKDQPVTLTTYINAVDE